MHRKPTNQFIQSSGSNKLPARVRGLLNRPIPFKTNRTLFTEKKNLFQKQYDFNSVVQLHYIHKFGLGKGGERLDTTL